MDLEEIVVSDVDLAVPDQALGLVDDGRQVVALEDVVALKAISLEVLDEVLGRVTVVAYLERVNLIVFHKLPEPLVSGVVIDEMLTG